MNRAPVKKTLLRACEEGDIKAVRLLLSHGADVNLKDPVGRTSLHHLACRFRGPLAIVRLLNAKNSSGCTPFDEALVIRDTHDCLEQLLNVFREYAPELVLETYCRKSQP